MEKGQRQAKDEGTSREWVCIEGLDFGFCECEPLPNQATLRLDSCGCDFWVGIVGRWGDGKRKFSKRWLGRCGYHTAIGHWVGRTRRTRDVGNQNPRSASRAGALSE